MNGIRVFCDDVMGTGESPLWEPSDNALYWIDIPQRKVYRKSAVNGDQADWSLPSDPGCIARCSEGIVVAMRNGISILDTSTGQLRQLISAPYEQSVQRFNDGRCDSHGRLWVGTIYEPRDRADAGLYCLDQSTLRRMEIHVTVSNGLAFGLNEKVLFHADTTAHKISAYDFDVASGSLSNPKTFRSFSRERGNAYEGRPDGAAVDEEGCYWVAMFEGGKILRLDPEGRTKQEILLPVRCPTMIAFGGSDMRTLYVTTSAHGRPAAEFAAFPLSGKILSLRVGVAGRPEPLFRLPSERSNS